MLLKKLTTGDRVVVVGAFLFFVFTFFPWYGAKNKVVEGGGV